MSRVFEAVKRFMLKEVLLQRFGEKVAEEGTAAIDVFLKKGKEYIVRGEFAKGHGKPVLSLVNATGSEVENQYNYGGNNIYATPDRDGLYRIVVARDHAVKGGGSVPVEVSLAHRLPPPQYIIDSINTLPCESDWPGFKEYESADDLSEREATAAGNA